MEEQKVVLGQIADERRSLAEERASFNITRHLATEESTRFANRNMRSELEVESTVKAINSEKVREKSTVLSLASALLQISDMRLPLFNPFS